MSIKNIQKIKHFGIFQNYTNTNAKDFGRYNLFYGWNGSGKSTLSTVFRCIENKSNPKYFPSAEFTISIDDGTTITQANIAESELNVYTFNQDFIDENISWSSIVKSILLVDKEKIEEREKLEGLKKTQKTDVEAHSKESEKIRKLSIGEGVSVISDIFEWISELDEKHYQEMLDVVT